MHAGGRCPRAGGHCSQLRQVECSRDVSGESAKLLDGCWLTKEWQWTAVDRVGAKNHEIASQAFDGPGS
jgi:hypothetical protein